MQQLTIEVMYKSDACLPCYYMDEAVREFLPSCADTITYERVDIKSERGKKRFMELSVALFGEEGVYKKKRIAPIPSLFINGELFFDAIPPRHELEAAVLEMGGEIPGNPGPDSDLLVEVIHEGEH